MSEISKVIESEIADFFAGFGGPGEPDIQNGEAQRLLTERVLSVLALRERAEPVEHESHIRREVNAGGNTWIQCSKQAFEREKARGALCRVLYESPPAPVVPDDVLAALRKVAKIRLDFNDFDGDRRGMADCLGEAEEALIEVVNRRAAMLAAPGKQPLSVDVLAGALRNAPQAPSDNQGRQRAPVAAGWIACSERMPEREYVLAADFSGAYYLPSLPNTQVGIYADWFEDGKPSWDDGDGNDLHLNWMPLPEAPGKEG